MKTIEEIRAAFQRIHDRACGNTSIVYMSIPADPRRDADIIVADAIDELATARERIAELEQESAERGILADRENKRAIMAEFRVAELERFKTYVHQRLDEAGIPTHPDGPHSKEGCRVGDRLDILIQSEAQADREADSIAEANSDLRERVAELEAQLEGALNKSDESRIHAFWDRKLVAAQSRAEAAEKEREDVVQALASSREQIEAVTVDRRRIIDATEARERALRETLETVRGRLSDVLGAQHVLKYALRFIRRWKADPNFNPDAEIEHAEKAIEEWHRKVVAVLDVARAALAASPDAAPAKPETWHLCHHDILLSKCAECAKPDAVLSAFGRVVVDEPSGTEDWSSAPATVHISRPDGVELYVPVVEVPHHYSMSECPTWDVDARGTGGCLCLRAALRAAKAKPQEGEG